MTKGFCVTFFVNDGELKQFEYYAPNSEPREPIINNLKREFGDSLIDYSVNSVHICNCSVCGSLIGFYGVEVKYNPNPVICKDCAIPPEIRELLQ